ncbi:MAG: hypothetical protein ABIT36_08565 [Steroidobacteraceae bacterium]
MAGTVSRYLGRTVGEKPMPSDQVAVGVYAVIVPANTDSPTTKCLNESFPARVCRRQQGGHW